MNTKDGDFFCAGCGTCPGVAPTLQMEKLELAVIDTDVVTAGKFILPVPYPLRGWGGAVGSWADKVDVKEGEIHLPFKRINLYPASLKLEK